MTLPALAYFAIRDQRVRPDRRRGRPRVEIDVEAIDILLAHSWSHKRIARALRISPSTIDRRVAERRTGDRVASALMYRCQECSSLSLTSICPRGHLIGPGFLMRP